MLLLHVQSYTKVVALTVLPVWKPFPWDHFTNREKRCWDGAHVPTGPQETSHGLGASGI